MKNLLLLALGAAALSAFAQKAPETIANPSATGSLQPSWSLAQDGSPMLSWIEKAKDDFAAEVANMAGA